MTVREVEQRTGISRSRLSRMETGEQPICAGDERLLEVALDGTPLAVPEVSAPAATVIARKERRAYVCASCRSRRFLRASEQIPECCGARMGHQPNVPYRGEAP